MGRAVSLELFKTAAGYLQSGDMRLSGQRLEGELRHIKSDLLSSGSFDQGEPARIFIAEEEYGCPRYPLEWDEEEEKYGFFHPELIEWIDVPEEQVKTYTLNSG
ncbi:hypothetical protein ACQZV8_18710 [Magnetococcales bacterium HHB-1]